MSLTSKYKNHLRKAIPLPEHFLTDAHIVRIDISCVMHNKGRAYVAVCGAYKGHRTTSERTISL